MSFQEVMSPPNFHFLGIKYEEKKIIPFKNEN